MGVLQKDGLFFIQQRPANGLMADLWEFPGGKINQGEKPEDALVREFQEELQFSIQVEKKITTLKQMCIRDRHTIVESRYIRISTSSNILDIKKKEVNIL